VHSKQRGNDREHEKLDPDVKLERQGVGHKEKFQNDIGDRHQRRIHNDNKGRNDDFKRNPRHGDTVTAGLDYPAIFFHKTIRFNLHHLQRPRRDLAFISLCAG
jgi:hypothetical protein